MKIGIYGVHNTTKDMWYIGSSSNIEHRLHTHEGSIRNKKGVFEGIDSDDIFEFNTLKIVKNIDSLELWENYYIGRYNSVDNGYNKILSSRVPQIRIKYYEKACSEIEIMDDTDLSKLLKIENIDDLEDIKNKIPHIKVTDSIKRYDKKEVINYLIKESALNEYFINIETS